MVPSEPDGGRRSISVGPPHRAAGLAEHSRYVEEKGKEKGNGEEKGKGKEKEKESNQGNETETKKIKETRLPLSMHSLQFATERPSHALPAGQTHHESDCRPKGNHAKGRKETKRTVQGVVKGAQSGVAD